MNTVIDDQDVCLKIEVCLKIMNTLYQNGSVSVTELYHGELSTFKLSLDTIDNTFTISRDSLVSYTAKLSNEEIIDLLVKMAYMMEAEEGNTIRISDFH
jgi:hypothetical protein